VATRRGLLTVIRQSGSVLVLLVALVAPAAAETPPPGPGPGRVFGYFDPGTGKFTMKENGAPRAETKPVKGTLTVHVDAYVSKPDPTGTIGCNVLYGTQNVAAYTPLQTKDQAAFRQTFLFNIGYIFSGKEDGTVFADCFAFTASGEQSGRGGQTVYFNNPNEEIEIIVTLQ
jgi:hypothetical protein